MNNVIPIRRDFVSVVQLALAVKREYNEGGPAAGASTGWRTLDEFYTVGDGQWTCITGIPGAGKSEWLDALLVNLAEADPSWFFVIYSPENFPTHRHVIKLIEKRARKPFAEGNTPRMSPAEADHANFWVHEHFVWLSQGENMAPGELLDQALQFGHNRRIGIVLDPWNTLDHQRGGLSETDYISQVLTEVTNLARSTGAHVWLVVHPAKMQRNKDGTRSVPTPYDISGSAHWYNKADNIITVHREQNAKTQDVDVHVQKVRFKHLGRVGSVTLKYDWVIGRYFEWNGPSIEGERLGDPERGAKPPEIDAERAAIKGEA